MFEGKIFFIFYFYFRELQIRHRNQSVHPLFLKEMKKKYKIKKFAPCGHDPWVHFFEFIFNLQLPSLFLHFTNLQISKVLESTSEKAHLTSKVVQHRFIRFRD